MSWYLATIAELWDIAYEDNGAGIGHKIAAGAEMKRRARLRRSEIERSEVPV